MTKKPPFSTWNLSEVSRIPRTEAGGKAQCLARLQHAGFPVPPGFVIPRQAVATILEQAAHLGTEGVFSADDVKIPEHIADVLRRESRVLGGCLAVRSSAVDEDGVEHSHAGIHRSILGVKPDDVPGAVMQVIASATSDAALAYRASRGLSGPSSMAVLVQQMVAPMVSGVMFTINPVSGSWREMIVEAVWGLGDALVSGTLPPHWFLVRRPQSTLPAVRLWSRMKLYLGDEALPDLAVRWVLGPEGPRSEPIPERLRGQRTLEHTTLLRICRLGLRIERKLGGPQDIEWALDDAGGIHVLQARPVTSVGTSGIRSDVLWTRRFIGERWPRPATPLGWSLVAPVLEWFVAYPRTQAGLLGGGPAFRLVRGYPYLNATVFRHLVFKLPGAPAPRFMLELLPPAEELAWRSRHGSLPGVRVYASLLRETLDGRRWRRFRWNPFTNHLVWDRWKDQLETRLGELNGLPDERTMAIEQVQRQLDLLRTYVSIHVTSLLFANLFYQLLEGALASWIPEEGAALLEPLAVCPPGNETLRINQELRVLGQMATAEDLDRLDRDDAPKEPFAGQLTVFLKTFGHRSDASWEIFAPRWGTEPRRLAALLRAQAGEVEPKSRDRTQEDEFVSARKQALAAVGWVRRPLLSRLIHYTRRYLALRENQRFWFDRIGSTMESTLLWLGREFVADRVLQEPADIAFLHWEEVQDLAAGIDDPHPFAERVKQRKVRHHDDAAIDPPTFFLGDEAIAPSPHQGRLQGLGISPGSARGRVRVLRSLEESCDLQRGDVIVARSVDPSWTSLFPTAAAVVLEMGGALSHGAVVGREYRIPMVVNIDGLLDRLVDGQEVTVDGTRGMVWVHT